jgi:hypothetical protein
MKFFAEATMVPSPDALWSGTTQCVQGPLFICSA